MNTAIAIVAIVFGWLTISSIISAKRSRERDKINAALRMEEMEHGYPPGTYSNFRKKGSKHKDADLKDFERQKDFKDRADLKNGIKNLQGRVANLDTILQEQAHKNKQGTTTND
ncbi:MAG: hypothetical protein LKE40_08535 [Spirochaetia bacterium]|jgi:hypothetical protein|nr:hypothetical protein [Spirochaetia bacterium]